ncbi:MAG: hypothetical protein KIG96_02080 [Treponema sp.]|nr:hypothetical protein [Treponema sp.]
MNTFIGHRFEQICETYLKEQFYNGKMPFFAENLGRWWGNNPVLKKQEEIDLLATDDENAVICECTFRCNLNCLHCGSDCLKTSETPDMPVKDFINVLDDIRINYKPANLFVLQVENLFCAQTWRRQADKSLKEVTAGELLQMDSCLQKNVLIHS